MKYKTYYVTTPIYYPNSEPHLGSCFTTFIADVLKRWKKLEGYETFLLTGTDEHGLKLQREAEKRGLKPKEFVDIISKKFREAWDKLNIDYDRFIRTTDKDHEEVVKWVFNKLWEKRELYKGTYKGWYCVGCERYYGEGEYIEKDGKKICPIHLKELEWIEEEVYFFRLSKYKDYVLDLLKSGLITPKGYANQLIEKLEREGLRDISVTRRKEKIEWGIDFPPDKEHVIYVWFDALLNYISGIKFLEDPKFFKKYWPAVHVIGKDILWFHGVIWPAILKAIDLEPPKKVVVHGFWTVDGLKMSKSLGNVIYWKDLVKWGDSIRYFLLRQSNFESDSDFSWKEFERRYNAELIGNLGNLVRRVGILAKKLRGVIKKDEIEIKGPNIEKIKKYINNYKFNLALAEIFNYIGEINKYLNKKEPWKKENPNKEIYNCLYGIEWAANLLYPFLPKTSEKIAESLGFEIKGFNIKPREKYIVKKAPIIFKKIEKQEIKMEKRVGIEVLESLGLKIGKIIEVNDHPNADKLYVLKVKIGKEERTLVAGLKEYYKKEELLGKKVVVATNLEKRKIRGIESDGMLLAGEKDGIVSLLTPDKEIEDGAIIR